ncbi:MAG TPA: hypothetical protein PK736_00165 [Bacteroidia bacterium]|nr:hypothetical protein [Bacteroidota bacterium]HRC31835.1 hypothetical protein [Bacteroidia bacterium]
MAEQRHGDDGLWGHKPWLARLGLRNFGNNEKPPASKFRRNEIFVAVFFHA